MAVPNMAGTPIIMNALEKRGLFAALPMLNMPVTTLVTGTVPPPLLCPPYPSAVSVCLTRLAYASAGVMLVFSTPLCCAIFPQQARMPIDQLEPELQARIARLLPHAQHVYFNKGL